MPGFHIHGHRPDAVPMFSCRYHPETYQFSVRVQWERHGSEYTGLEVEDIRQLAEVLRVALRDHEAGPEDDELQAEMVVSEMHFPGTGDPGPG